QEGLDGLQPQRLMSGESEPRYLECDRDDQEGECGQSRQALGHHGVKEPVDEIDFGAFAKRGLAGLLRDGAFEKVEERGKKRGSNQHSDYCFGDGFGWLCGISALDLGDGVSDDLLHEGLQTIGTQIASQSSGAYDYLPYGFFGESAGGGVSGTMSS